MMYSFRAFQRKMHRKSLHTTRKHTDDHVPTLPASSYAQALYTRNFRVLITTLALSPQAQHYYCAMLLSLRKCAIASGSAFSFFHAATCLKI